MPVQRAYHALSGTSAVVWFLGDQPAWGKRIARLGIGTPAVRFSRFSAAWLDRTLQQLTSDQQMRARAAELGARIRAEDGLGEAVAAIERLAASLRWLTREVQRGGAAPVGRSVEG